MSSVRLVKTTTSNFENWPLLEVSLQDFIEIVDSFESELVFFGDLDYHKKEVYFFSYMNVFIYTNFVPVDSWEDFKNQYELMVKGGFNDVSKFTDALMYGIDNMKKYQDFIGSEVYSESDARYADPPDKKRIYAKYIDFANSGFKQLSDYEEASELNISEVADYYLFKSSEWYKTDYWNPPEHNDYLNFKDALQKGFTTKKEYERAKELGFLTAKTYKMFVESGLKTKDEFDYLLREFPPFMEKELKLIDQIKAEADVSFKESRYQESVRKDFLQIEKILNLAYVVMYKRKVEKEILYDEVLKDLKSRCGLEIQDVNEFNNCRRLRNRITHENYKVTEQETSKAKTYLEELGSLLRTFILTTVEVDFKTI